MALFSIFANSIADKFASEFILAWLLIFIVYACCRHILGAPGRVFGKPALVSGYTFPPSGLMTLMVRVIPDKWLLGAAACTFNLCIEYPYQNSAFITPHVCPSPELCHFL